MKFLREQFQKAVEAFQAGEWNESEQICHSILRSIPQHPDVLHLLGLVLYQQGNKQQAVLYLKQAIAHANTIAQG